VEWAFGSERRPSTLFIDSCHFTSWLFLSRSEIPYGPNIIPDSDLVPYVYTYCRVAITEEEEQMKTRIKTRREERIRNRNN